LKEVSKEDARAIVLKEQSNLTLRDENFPLEKQLTNIWFKKFTAWLKELEADTGSAAAGPNSSQPSTNQPEHVNKSKEKAKDAELLKKRKTVQSFLSFSSRSEVGVTAKEVFEQSSDIPLPKVTSILQIAERSLKKARLDEGSTVEHRTHLKKEDQLKVAQYMSDQSFSFKRTNQEFPHFNLKQQTVSLWKTNYEGMCEAYRKEGHTHSEARKLAAEEYISGVKQGRPTLLATSQHNMLLTLLKGIRSAQGKVTPLIVMAVGEAVVIDAGLGSQLPDNGGTLVLGYEWARGILRNALGWTERKATTDRKMTSEELKEAAEEARALEEKIALYHPALVYEMDETLAPWCPVDDTTYAEEGSGRVAMQGTGDKRGNTATLTIKRNNELLGLQTIWEGITDRSLPQYKWGPGHIACFAGATSEKVSEAGKKSKKSNKWQNRKTMKEYVVGILQPDIERVRKSIPANEFAKYPMGDRALYIDDYHWSHEGEWVTPLFEELRVDHGRVPKKATDYFSGLDVAINKPFKGNLKNSFSKHCTSEILKQLKAGIKPENVKLDTRASTIKPMAARWIHDAWKSLKAREEDLVKNAWAMVEKNIKEKLGEAA
jgi:hypothetical protein